MRSTLLLCLLSFLFTNANAQTRLVGRVIDKAGKPVPDARVWIQGSIDFVAVDSAGRFSIEVPKLPATLQAGAEGVASTGLRISSRDRDKEVLLRLAPQTTRAFDPELLNSRAAPVFGYLGEVTLTAPSHPSARIKPAASASDGITTTARPESRTTARETGGRIRRTVAPPANARQLTAAEVNDFKKWGLWNDYSEGEFNRWSAEWGLSFRKRYCVLVESTDRSPLPGLPVYLLSEDGRDTIWAAVTDNTGKAELWADGERSTRVEGLQIVCSGQSLAHPAPFEQDINRIRLKRPCDNRSRVDIAFVVDATGSMTDEIRFLQSDLQKIITTTAERHRDIQLRTAGVFYRDRGDEYLTRVSEFNDGASVLSEFISRQAAGGGGDRPEAVEAGLYAAIHQLYWSEGARAKLLFLILDAHPHEEARTQMQQLIRTAAARGIRIIPVVCSGATKTLEYLMRCVALATNGNYVFLTDDSGIGDKHLVATTDAFQVELLHDLLLRLIDEMISVEGCGAQPMVRQDGPANPEVKVYPNPTPGRVVLESSAEILDVLLTDITGKVLRRQPRPAPQPSGKPAPASLPLDFSDYPSGTYLIRYQTGDKNWRTEKIIVRHE